jgi:hypothetical protein
MTFVEALKIAIDSGTFMVTNPRLSERSSVVECRGLGLPMVVVRTNMPLSTAWTPTLNDFLTIDWVPA